MGWPRAIIRAAFFPACVIVSLGLFDSFLPNFTLFILYPLSLIALLIWALIHFVHAAKSGWRGERRVAAIHMLAIVLVALVFRPAAQSASWAGRYVHLLAFVVWNEVSPVKPDKHEGRADIFYWGGQGLAAGASELRYLVRDTSVKTRNDIGEKPSSDYPGLLIETRRLAGNYYLRTVYYP